MHNENINTEEFCKLQRCGNYSNELAHTVQTFRRAGERSETMLKIWWRSRYATHVGSSCLGTQCWKLSPLLFQRMDTFSVHFFLNVWQQHLWSMDTHQSYMPELMGRHFKCEHQARQFLDKISSHLAGCMPQRKTALTPISSWRALASSSLCTLPKLPGQPPCVSLRESTRRRRLAWIMNTSETVGKQTHMITRSETFIPGVTCPGLVVFGTWVKSLGGGFDPVINLQRRIYTCKKTTPKRTWLKVLYWQHVAHETIILCQRYRGLEKCCRVLPNQMKHPKA